MPRKRNDPPPPATPPSLPIIWKKWNGCRECDAETVLHNLKLAPLDGTVGDFIKWLRKFNHEHQRAWWKSMGWSEGYNYFQGASADGQQSYFAGLKVDRDIRFPDRIETEKVLKARGIESVW